MSSSHLIPKYQVFRHAWVRVDTLLYFLVAINNCCSLAQTILLVNTYSIYFLLVFSTYKACTLCIVHSVSSAACDANMLCCTLISLIKSTLISKALHLKSILWLLSTSVCHLIIAISVTATGCII